jgi:hypothetical protein
MCATIIFNFMVFKKRLHLILGLIFVLFFLYARLKTGRIMLWRCPSVRASVRPAVAISVFRTFFAIFAAIGLKLGVLLCSQELLFQFAFRCN